MVYFDIDVNKEAEKKIDNWKQGRHFGVKTFQNFVYKKFGKEISKCSSKSIDKFFKLRLKNNYHNNLNSYITHTLRVATSLIGYESKFLSDQIAVAIYHNLFEVFDVSKDETKTLLQKEDYIETVKLLCIDRKKTVVVLSHDPAIIKGAAMMINLDSRPFPKVIKVS